MIWIVLLLVLIGTVSLMRAYITERDRWLIVAGLSFALTFLLIGTEL